MLIKSQKDFFSGLLFTTIGVVFGIGAKSYTIGTAARMGPGYFPLMLSVLLAGMGVLIMLSAILRRHRPLNGDPIGPWAWRPLFYILAANFAFGILLVGLPALGIPSFGLMVAIYALVLISGRAAFNASLKSSLILATVLAVGSYVVFIKSMGLVLPVWPSFLVG